MAKKTLNEHLFDQLERLSNCTNEDIELEMNKSNSIISVSEQILSVAKMKLDIIQAGVNVGENFNEISEQGTKQIENGNDVDTEEITEENAEYPSNNLEEDVSDTNASWANGFRPNNKNRRK